MDGSKVMLGGLCALLVAVGLATGVFLYRSAPAPSDATAPAQRERAGESRDMNREVRPQPDRGPGDSRPETKLGLSLNDPRAFPGYTLVASLASPATYLIDMEGRVVHRWEGDRPPALSASLLESGTLLRPGSLIGEPHALNGSGAGGRLQEFAWNGELVWDFQYATDDRLLHHDVVWLPNGNVLAIAWDRQSREAAAEAGRTELSGQGDFLPDCLVEIKPGGKHAGQVVWEWRVWDHLIQDRNASKANFGDVAAHPERIDINFGESPMAAMSTQRDGVAKLRSLGYVGATSGKKAPRLNADWTHINAVDYNRELDQILLTVHAFSEVWVIDHSTTTAEAAARSGGRGTKGGDLLYRWGNPRAHRAGTLEDQRLYFPHSAHWIARGLPGERHLLIFNNGPRRPGGPFSSVDEVALPVDAQGRYPSAAERASAPRAPVWSYTAPRKIAFYSMLLSGAQRLPNGNTLICSGMSGTIFEVTPLGDVVWQYTSPVAPGPAGSPGFGPAGGSALFRAYRYAPQFPGVAGKDLTPGATVDRLDAAAERK